jgi:uncharacterized membrane protein YebE (DUF533 family)
MEAVHRQRLTISGHACTETLALLIAVAWADGRLDDKEKEGVRAAAKVLNLTKELRDRIDRLLDRPLPVDQLLFDTMSARERAFAFVAASWMARVDESLDPKEEALLDELATTLELSKEREAELLEIATDLGPRSEATDGWAQEVVTLFKAIPPRLEAPGPGEDVDVEFD